MDTMGIRKLWTCYCITTLNCHWNTLLEERSFPPIGCAKRARYSADFCNEAVSLVWQGTKSLYRHRKKTCEWRRVLGRLSRLLFVLLLLRLLHNLVVLHLVSDAQPSDTANYTCTAYLNNITVFVNVICKYSILLIAVYCLRYLCQLRTLSPLLYTKWSM